MGSKSLGVLIMAAGKGTRMHSERPKVLQSLLEEPVVYYILDTVHRAGLTNVAVLVGHRGDMVEAYVKSAWPDVEIIWQREQLGTGHAVQVSQDWWSQFEDLLVLSGDVPLVSEGTIERLINEHEKRDVQCTLVSAELDDPTGYGRIIRLADGGVRIVEQRDASDDVKHIKEINAGLYVFETKALAEVISNLSPTNEQHEYYLTDAVQLISETEGETAVIVSPDFEELRGVNTPCDLAITSRTLNERILNRHMMAGLKCIDPSSTWIGPRVEIEPDVTIEPGVHIWGASKIGERTRIGAHSTLTNAIVGSDCMIVGPCVIFDSELGSSVDAGPFAYLRNGVVMGDSSRVGRFVEIKNSAIGQGAKVPHLSYIGDATIGDGTNIGAGTITCNYDGKDKHSTSIGSNCLIGSDTMFVAPVSVGDDAATGAGSVITEDVPDGALGIGRSRQKNIEGWKHRG